MYFGQVNNAGDGGNKVDSVVTDVCTSLYVGQPNNRILDYGLNAYASIGVPNHTWVSKTKTTRYGIDLEDMTENVVSLWQFNSADSPTDKPLLDVGYRSTFDFYGAALGDARWAGFDTLLVPDLGSSLSYERLDETLPIYLVWQNSDATGMQKLTPPIRIDQTSWWGTPGFTAADLAVSVSYDPPLDQEYHACPEGQGLQEVTLHEDGKLTVRDLNFGGIGSKTRIELRATDPDPQKSLVRVIALQWDNPGTYYDAELGQNVNAAPDSNFTGIVTVEENIDSEPGLSFPLRLPTRIVEWVSTDIAGVDSIRVVQELDLAALSDELGNPFAGGSGRRRGTIRSTSRCSAQAISTSTHPILP